MTPCFRGVSARNFEKKLRESSRCFSASFRGVSPRNFAEKKSGLRELTRNLAEFSPRKFAFENFCSRREREKKSFFSWADLYMYCKMNVHQCRQTLKVIKYDIMLKL